MKEKENILLQETKDGSHTLYNVELDETYHSSHGAIQEAQHVFIKNGIQSFKKDSVSILEVGLGTGLNAYLTYQYSTRNCIDVNYVGLEAFPLSNSIVERLNYYSEIEEFDSSVFEMLHNPLWDEHYEISPKFVFAKNHITLQKYTSEKKFDVIYYDAFGPRAQKEMWDISLFSKLYSMLNHGGKLVTYCAMGQFKRDLKTCGYTVESVPGPPGQREMTLAFKL